MNKSRIIAAALLAALSAAGGCASDATKGYSLARPHRDDVRTVAVDIFTRGKDVYRRDVEMRLTEAIIKRIELDTPYKVTTKARADTLLTGTIVSIGQRVMSSNPRTGASRELQMVISVTFRWSDLRSGETIVERKGLRAAGTYIPPAPFGEDFFHGSQEALDRLALRVVENMEAAW